MQPAHSAQSDVHRQLLMHCEVINPDGERSERFIDHSLFPLWRYLLIHRHGFAIHAARPTMWVPEQQWRRHDQLFERARAVSEVSRLRVKSFDVDTGLTQDHIRFTPQRQTELLSELLLKHLARGAQRDMVLHTDAGGAVATSY